MVWSVVVFFLILAAALDILGFFLWYACSVPQSQVLGPALVRGKAVGRRVAVTFDDGPLSPYTEQILDILRELKVPARVAQQKGRQASLGRTAWPRALSSSKFSHVILVRSPVGGAFPSCCELPIWFLMEKTCTSTRTREKLKWRGIAAWRKATCHYPGLTWKELLKQFLPASRRIQKPPESLVKLVSGTDSIQMFSTPWGGFSLPKSGEEVLAWLLHDIFLDVEYENGLVSIEKGDVVVDCGAHVGVFARFAFSRGASRVICAEMDDLNFECLQQNLSSENQRILMIHTALWSKPATLNFFAASASDCHRADVAGSSATTKDGRPLDEILASLQLQHVDFMKMDVEGAEPEVLKGALGTIQRFRPKLAIAVYHDPAEETQVRQVFRDASINYEFSYRRLAGAKAYILFGKAAQWA